MLVPRLCMSGLHRQSTLNPTFVVIPQTSFTRFCPSSLCIPRSNQQDSRPLPRKRNGGPMSPPVMSPYPQYHKLSFSQVSRCRCPYGSTTSSTTLSFMHQSRLRYICSPLRIICTMAPYPARRIAVIKCMWCPRDGTPRVRPSR